MLSVTPQGRHVIYAHNLPSSSRNSSVPLNRMLAFVCGLSGVSFVVNPRVDSKCQT